MASYHHSSANDRAVHKHCKQSRRAHDKQSTEAMARDSSHRSRGRTSHHHTDDPCSDSSDEILIKGRASRRFRPDIDRDVARQLKSIEKAQRGPLRPSSSSSQEIHIHYVPVVTKSVSPPLTTSSQSQSRSSTCSKSAGITASEITSQLKGITMSWLGRRSDDSHKSSRRSRSRSKHRKRDKHGKKRMCTSKFLAPLAQRWVCYKCGKLRSDRIQERHPLKEGQKMQPNWCGKCRVHGELHGRALVFDGQRHYCWGCGIVRSRTYHNDNPIEKNEMSTPNYCKPCREASPAFDYNLREASETGSVASIRDKVNYLPKPSTYYPPLTLSQQAFYRQMHDAELSDVDEEEDGQATCAPGKENQNPRSKKLKASKSFMLENCSYKVKTTSDASSEHGVPISILKALHLDEERARSTSSGGCRLSDGSYQPPTVESELSEDLKSNVKARDVAREALATIDGDEHFEVKNSSKSASDDEPSSPTTILAPNKRDSGDSSTKKKVHWIKQAAQPMTAGSNASDSAYYSGYPSDLSYKSIGCRRSRRDPGDVSTGSPPIQEGESTAGDLRHDIRNQEKASLRRHESGGKGSGKDLPAQRSFGEPAHALDVDMASYWRNSTQSSHSQSILPVPPEFFEPATTGLMNRSGRDKYESSIIPQIDSPEIPNFSRPYLSPPKQRAKVSHDPDPTFSSDFDTHSSYVQDYSFYQSAANFSDSTQRRDFSGFSPPGEDYAASQYEHYGHTVSHGDWSPVSCPIDDDDDYNISSEDDKDGSFRSYGDNDSFPPATGYSGFDFSGLGGFSPSKMTGVDAFAPEDEKFVRKKKTTQSTPSQHSWRLYDDGDDDGSAPDIEGCRWRKDGRTTVHHSGGGQVPNEGKTVQIVSIREMGSDEELNVSEGWSCLLACDSAVTSGC